MNNNCDLIVTRLIQVLDKLRITIDPDPEDPYAWHESLTRDEAPFTYEDVIKLQKILGAFDECNG